MLWVAPSEKDTATDALEKRLWDAADQLRANSSPFSDFTLTNHCLTSTNAHNVK